MQCQTIETARCNCFVSLLVRVNYTYTLHSYIIQSRVIKIRDLRFLDFCHLMSDVLQPVTFLLIGVLCSSKKPQKDNFLNFINTRVQTFYM